MNQNRASRPGFDRLFGFFGLAITLILMVAFHVLALIIIIFRLVAALRTL